MNPPTIARSASADPWSELLDTVESVEGWLARSEARLLAELAGTIAPPHCALEIGNYRGRSTVALGLGARGGKGARVYSVDPHHEFIGARGGRFGGEDQAQLYANLARTGVGPQVNVVGLDSIAAARAWSSANVALFFVDGDHRYEAVRADFEAWRPHMAPRAQVLFDDADFVDVERALNELVEGGVLVRRGRTGKIAWCELAG
ncbi:MAG: class I SAM-dependent methyltransferase [Planctomycetes bacterium]|nr:class I SAM-dependent methyltransferase [Planctomycetota bacterium]